MTRGNGQKAAWQAHDKCVGSGVHSPNRGQNHDDESKSGEGSMGNKGGWDMRKGGDDDDDGKETMTVMGRRR